MNYVLGLDLGTNSVGWAVVELDERDAPRGLVDCGVRIFESPVEPKSKTPLNAARRAARLQRRQLDRRKRRRFALRRLLENAGMLPKDPSERQKILLDDSEYNPYDLRKKGLDKALSLFEFGRVLYHLNQRRGFRSNRKTLLSDALRKMPELRDLVEADDMKEGKAARTARRAKTGEADESGTLAAISELNEMLQATGSRTVGEYLWAVRHGKAARPDSLPALDMKKLRGLHTERAMYEQEFELLWKTQAEFHPSVLTDELKARVASVMFFQRPLKLQKFLVGDCPFEYHRKRAAKGTLEFQRFRILQQVNDLAIKDTLTREYVELSEEQREKMIALLEVQEKPTMKKIKRLLGLHENETLNFEEGGKEELIGNRTACRMRSILGEDWDAMEREHQQALVEDMLTIERKDYLLRRLLSHWRFSPEQAYKLALAELEAGYGSLSMKAIRQLSPLMENGVRYATACERVGYVGSSARFRQQVSRLPAPPVLRNPVVQKAVHECHRIVNEVVRVFGKPTVIRIELARDMKLSKKQKDAVLKQNRINKRLNELADEAVRQITGAANPSHEDRLKYRLWCEAKGRCPYTLRSISLEMLFGPNSEIDIDHIIPYSRSLDDSYMNKTICFATVNRHEKKNMTPYEAYGKTPERYEQILVGLSHLDSMPAPKKRRFEVKEIKTDEMVSRQLNDTRYICREVHNYLQLLGCKVQVTKGEATHALRQKWSLNNILSPDGSNAKNRGDHRHHAIDAIVTAVTDVALFQSLSRLSAQSGLALRDKLLEVPEPWTNCYRDVERKIESVIVSHAANHKLRRALHEATAYGPTNEPGVFVARAGIETLKPKHIPDVRDSVVRELIASRMADNGNSAEKAFATPLLHKDGKTPIIRVRLNTRMDPNVMLPVKDHSGREYKFYKFGNNHHAEVVEEIATGKWELVIVNTLESAARARRFKEPIIRTDWGEGKRLVMAIFANDLLELDIDGATEVYRVKSFENSASAKRLYLWKHNCADPEEKELRLVASKLKKARPRLLTVDRLGKIQEGKALQVGEKALQK